MIDLGPVSHMALLVGMHSTTHIKPKFTLAPAVIPNLPAEWVVQLQAAQGQQQKP